jgi:hypothetical protein
MIFSNSGRIHLQRRQSCAVERGRLVDVMAREKKSGLAATVVRQRGTIISTEPIGPLHFNSADLRAERLTLTRVFSIIPRTWIELIII